MTETLEVVTALVRQLPMCLECLGLRACASREDVETGLAAIGDVLVIAREDHGRCQTCGAIGPVVSLYGRSE